MKSSRALVVLCVLACAGEKRAIVYPQDLALARDKPFIERVLDLGNLNGIPSSLPMNGGDGVFVVGEHILIEGKEFGRLPTISIGGKAAAIDARTAGGGVVTRIPSGVSSGRVEVEISHPQGKHSKAIEVRRYLLASRVDANQVHVLDLSGQKVDPLKAVLPIQVPMAVTFSHDGSMAYVASSAARNKGLIFVVAMGAKGGPRIVQEITTLWEARAIAAAERAPLMAVVGRERVELYSLSDPQNPIGAGWVQLPGFTRTSELADAQLDPTGKVLLLLYQDNKLLPIHLASLHEPKVLEAIDLLPGEANVLEGRRLRFSSDGKAIWIMTVGKGSFAGDNRIVKVSRDRWSISQSFLVASGRQPAAFVLGMTRNFKMGTAIRADALGDSLFIATHDGAEKAIFLLNEEGDGEPLILGPWVFSAIDFASGSQVLLAAACKAGSPLAEYGVTWVDIWGDRAPHYVKLADAPSSSVPPCFEWAADIRAQP